MIKIHLPTKEYAFVEVEYDSSTTFIEIKQAYDDLEAVFEPKEGLDQKEWNAVLDKYLTDNTMESSEYERMSMKQQRTIQELKKSFKRLKANS